jgi:translation initiation factor IF-2
MRGPGMPSAPSFPGGPRRPGMRPMHPTTPLRPESAVPMPTEQRRHQGKPGGRPTARTRKDQEGVFRERVPKRLVAQEPPPIDREITVAEGVTVKELSEKLGVKANLVVKKLVEKKIFATINQTLDVKLAEELAREFGASTNQVSYEEESTQDIEQAEETADLVRRAPVVTIMGHVDHGKTSLLDAIRQTNIAGREAGGITQHIGAYHIEKNGRKIVFIDTPGHQAFTRMRARGAKVTDIVVLVVSADDGVMPQTLEAIDHARAAGVPLMVAINKIDKPDAQPERVKQQLADRGLQSEDWGGDTVMVPVSAKTGQNLDLLLEMILLMADIQDFKANPNRPAVGTVLEAQLDKGRGPVATMLVRNGTLRVGDFFICGALFNKVRAMFDDRGNPVREAEPSMPVEVIGLESLPEVGDSFQVVSDTSKAKQIVVYREAKAREVAMAKGARVATLDSLHKQFQEGDLKDLNLIIKADVGGTAEVLSDSLQQLSNEKVRVRVLHAGVGAITESDVLLASASEALVIGFNVRPERNAQATADQQKVDIRLHSIIYELIDEIKLAMTGLLDPVFKETVLGHAEVREVFKISKVGTVAGCYVADGVVRRDSQIRVIRDGAVIHTAKIDALKRFKNDASEVKNGLECGISLVNFNNINVGDVLESFTMERVAPQLPGA